MGILKINGFVELKQFWPTATSDADTTKVLVNVNENSFSFQPYPGVDFQETKIFEDAEVRGKGVTKVIKNGKVTIRLQGADAPELHFRPVLGNGYTQDQRDEFKKYNEEYRQYWGETATVKLFELLSKDQKEALPCFVETNVEHPNDVCDVYGRIVGDIIITIDGRELYINHWLVAQGYAFPSFYSSMKNHEIKIYLPLIDKARAEENNIYAKYSQEFKDFNFDMIYRKGAQPDPVGDNKSPVQFPKLFRRFATYSAMKKANITTSSFEKFLSDANDGCFETNDFIENNVHSAKRYILSDFVQSDEFTSKPEGLVFLEKPSTLVDSNGNKITEW
jgi:endonuclease YncB( thermonuclease family)